MPVQVLDVLQKQGLAAKYDFILTSETLYDMKSHKRLLQVLKQVRNLHFSSMSSLTALQLLYYR